MTTPAPAYEIRQPNCGDFTHVKDNYKTEYMAVADGYDEASKKVDEIVDLEAINNESASVQAECAKKRLSPFGDASKKSLNSSKRNFVTAKEFKSPQPQNCKMQ